MAILKGSIKKMTGSTGELTFRANSGRTIVSEKPASVRNTRSAAQQRIRMKWSNIIQMYKVISPLINYGFEKKNPGVTDYNMFVKVNMQMQAVYLTKAEVAGGACVAAPYQITQGTLPSIEVSGNGADRKTDIFIGELVINDSTTVGDFSAAVVTGNDNYQKGDQISFFSILQFINPTSGVPYVRATASSVILDPKSNTGLWTVVNKAGFTNKAGFLAHGADEGNGVYGWVHSRNKDGKIKVSPQILLDNNALLSGYTSEDAYYEAVNTYGGESDVFLSPGGTVVSRSNEAASSSGSSSQTVPGGDGI